MKAEEVTRYICSEYFTGLILQLLQPQHLNPSFISELWYHFKSSRIQEKHVYSKQMQIHEGAITFHDMICS